MDSYELLVKGFLDAHHDSKVRICEELGLITQKDLDLMVNVENWLPLWKTVFRSVREKGLQSQLWERLRREGVVHHDPNPFEVADLVSEVSHGVSAGFTSRAEMEVEKSKADARRVKDLAAAGLDEKSYRARAEGMSEQAAAYLGMSPEDLDACGDVNTKTVERILDFTEKLENGAAISNRRPSREEFIEGAKRAMDNHERYLEATAEGQRVKAEIMRAFQEIMDGDTLEKLLRSGSLSPQLRKTIRYNQNKPIELWVAELELRLRELILLVERTLQKPSCDDADSVEPEGGQDGNSYVSADEIYSKLVDRYRYWQFAEGGKPFTFDIELDNDEDQVRLVNYQSGEYCWMIVLYPMPAGKVNAVCVSGKDNIKKAYGMNADHIDEERLGERVIDVQAIFNGEDWWTNGPEREINYATTWAFTTGQDQLRHWWLHGAGEKTACGKMLDIYDHPSATIREQPTTAACPDCLDAWNRLMGERGQTSEEN